jgi:hypothetical protein
MSTIGDWWNKSGVGNFTTANADWMKTFETPGAGQSGTGSNPFAINKDTFGGKMYQDSQDKLAQPAKDAAAAGAAASQAASNLATQQKQTEDTANANLGQQNNLEQQMMDTYRKRQAGQNLF